MASIKRRRNNSREVILDAAEQVAVKRGAGKVSLDSVAEEAGLTKGGVLYSFPSKEALIEGMLTRLTSTYQPLFEQAWTERQGQANPSIKASVQVTRQLDDLHPNIAMAILAAAAQNLSMLDPLREQFARRYRKISTESKDPQLATALWAAAEGLMLMHMLGLLPFDHTEKAAVLQRIEALAEDV